MRVFCSVPMKGLTDQNIDDELELVAKIAEAYFPLAELEFVTNFGFTEEEDIPDTVRNKSVWYLGEALKSLSTCDAILCPNETGNNGCITEKGVAQLYDIPVYEYDIRVLNDFLKGEFHNEHNTEDRNE